MPAFIMGGATALQAGGSIFSGIMGKSAAKKQAEAIKAAQNEAAHNIRAYSANANAELAPWRTRGNEAGQTLADLLSGKLDPNAVLKASSLFKFQEQEGSIALNRELKARGLYGSGAGLESLRKFENQLVGEEGQRQYDRLFQQSEQGRVAATTMSANDMNAGNALANINLQGGMAIGQANAQGQNAFGQGISGAMNAVAGGGMQYMNYKMLEPILAQLGGGKDSTYTEAQALGMEQNALGRGIVAGTGMPGRRSLFEPTGDEYSMDSPGMWNTSSF